MALPDAFPRVTRVQRVGLRSGLTWGHRGPLVSPDPGRLAAVDLQLAHTVD
jgi:hypothetical protein